MAKEINSDHSNAVGFRERERAVEPPSVHWFISPSATGRRSTGMSTEGWESFTSLSSAYWSKDVKKQKNIYLKKDTAKSWKLFLQTFTSCKVLLLPSVPLVFICSDLQRCFPCTFDIFNLICPKVTSQLEPYPLGNATCSNHLLSLVSWIFQIEVPL